MLQDNFTKEIIYDSENKDLVIECDLFKNLNPNLNCKPNVNTKSSKKIKIKEKALSSKRKRNLDEVEVKNVRRIIFRNARKKF